jgi:hypothetical protein
MDRDPPNDPTWAVVAHLSPVGARPVSAPRASPFSTLASDVAAPHSYEADAAYARACLAYESSNESSFHSPSAPYLRYRAQPRRPTSPASSASPPSGDDLSGLGGLPSLSDNFGSRFRALYLADPQDDDPLDATHTSHMTPMTSVPFLLVIWVLPHRCISLHSLRHFHLWPLFSLPRHWLLLQAQFPHPYLHPLHYRPSPTSPPIRLSSRSVVVLSMCFSCVLVVSQTLSRIMSPVGLLFV